MPLKIVAAVESCRYPPERHGEIERNAEPVLRLIAAAQLQQYGLYGLTDEQLDGFAAKLLEDEKQRQHLYERALDNKVFDVIRENVKLEEQEISMADFEKLFQK